MNFNNIKDLFPQAVETIAVDGSQIDLSDTSLVHPIAKYHIEYNLSSDHVHFPNKGAVGCYLSHYNLWRKCIDLNIKKCIIIEDDVTFTENKKTMIRNLCSTIPRDAMFAALLYIYSNKENCQNKWCSISDRAFAGTQAYYLTHEGAKILCANALPIVTQVDIYIGYIASTYPEFNALVPLAKIYSWWDMLKDNCSSSIGHRFTIKKYLPHNNIFYIIVFILLLGLIVYILFKQRP